MRPHALRAAALLAALSLPAGLRAQAAASPLSSPASAASVATGGDSAHVPAGRAVVRALATIGSRAEERLRDDQLRGRVGDAGWLLRSPSSLTPWSPSRTAASVVAPELSLAWASRIPVARNDGGMRPGRGAGTLVMTGMTLQAGPLRLIVAPELAWEENREFDDLLPPGWTAEQRATFRTPWARGRNSVDLPYRYGTGSGSRVLPGESSLTLRAGAVAVGAATEEQWWGPGVRTAILFSNQAAGVPHLFARTARPVRTPLGAIEAKWVVGGLRRSEWAPDTDAEWRSLSSAGVVLHPAGAPGLSLGLARSVYADADGGAGSTLSRAADAFTRWRGAGDTLAAHPFEQMTSLFGRWVFPTQGAEIYAEWARYRFPTLRQLLETPEHTQGYVLGGQWLRPSPSGRNAVRLQGEVTFLERSPAYAAQPDGSWYASAAVPEGYTHRGEVVGSLVGPGGSGQFAGIDWLRGEGRLGAFAGRVRWANDAYYDTPGKQTSTYRGHDVSVFAGARAALALGPLGLDGEYQVERRLNYLFQNTSLSWSSRDRAVNVINHAFQLRVSARPRGLP